uniref:Uncharacterized protein n=1 Tax=Panagrolaimus davidi TaxID=227884 RepID=A0A914PNV6_9BILA
MTSFAYQNNNGLADPGFIETLKNCNDRRRSVVHYNVKQMLIFFVNDRKKLKAEKTALEISAAEIMEKCDQITAHFALQEETIKNLVQQISNLQADLRRQQVHYERLQSTEKKQVQRDISRLEEKVNDLTKENRSLAAELKTEFQKSIDREKEVVR